MTASLLAAGSMVIGPVDLAVIIVYLVVIVGMGCWVGMRRRGGGEGKKYFLAGGTLTWPVIGLALFSTNISTIHLVGFAQEGYVNGLAYGNYEWMAPFLLIVLALFFAPFYIRSQVATLPDFLEQRYGRSCRDWLALLSIISAVFIHIGFTLYMGAVVLEGLFGIPIMVSVVVAAVLTGLYTIVGGLLAVVITESAQTVVLLIGAITITIVGYWRIGGWAGLSASVEPVKLTMLRSADDPANLPWYSVFLGYPIIGLWYWCADQTIVQRVLGARSEDDARVGPLFAGFIKILPVFIFVLPGTICLGLVNQGKLPMLEDSKDAYAFLIKELLPTGLTGIMAAALLAALMSTVSGALNSIATLFSYDLYKRWRPDTPDHKLVVIGRIATFAAMVLAILWTPLISHYESMYQGCVALICYIAPPITAVFVLGVFWRRASARAAITTLVVGSVLGFVVFLLEWFKETTGWTMSPMLASFYLCMICVGIQVLVSMARPHEHTPQSEKLVWKHPWEALQASGWRGIGNYKLLAGVLFVSMVGLYVGFSKLSVKPADPLEDAAPKLKFAYYEGAWETRPDLRTLEPLKTGLVDTFDLAPALRDDGFVVEYTGFLDVAEKGRYTFYVTSEDDVEVRLGAIRLDFRDDAESDGKQKEAFIDLAEGKHRVAVVYYRKAIMEPVGFSDVVEIPRDGAYTFHATSDDGQDVPIGTAQAPADETSEENGALDLRAGRVKVTLTLAEEPGPASFEIAYQGPGADKREVEAGRLFHDRANP